MCQAACSYDHERGRGGVNSMLSNHVSVVHAHVRMYTVQDSKALAGESC